MLCNSHSVVMLCLLRQSAKLLWWTPRPCGTEMTVHVSVLGGCLSESQGLQDCSATWGLGSLFFHGDSQISPEGDLEQLRQLPLYEKWCLRYKVFCAGWCGCHRVFYLIAPMCAWLTPQKDTWATSLEYWSFLLRSQPCLLLKEHSAQLRRYSPFLSRPSHLHTWCLRLVAVLSL